VFDAPGQAPTKFTADFLDRVPHRFVFATGIECSAPRIASGGRHDQLVKTGHWTRYAEDARLVRELGIPFLRYGIPFHVVARDPGRLDWEWTDRALDALTTEGIEPIADLLHFAIPDDLEGMGDPRLVGRFLDFADAFAARYPWIRWYTPVNEPYITALFSGRNGIWNERGTTDAAFVRALDTIVECAVRGTEAIRSRRPDAVILQSDACDRYAPAVPEASPLAAFLDERRYVGFDLTLGRVPEPSVVAWLDRNGLDERRVAWFMDHAVRDGFIVGLDYYDGNERLVDVDGSVTSSPAPWGLAGMTRPYVERYGRPLMVAETNQWASHAVGWLDELWADVVTMRDEGLPFVGFCWYSLTDQVDWDIQLREDRGRLNTLGLVDLDRNYRPVGLRYRELARDVAAGVFESGDDRRRVA
jgi:beta-glucosidase/6-phospho-beta-glucosidase/beta-galactosidase